MHPRSNPYLRFVSGPDRNLAPWRDIGAADEAAAWQLLSQFTVVMPLASLGTRAAAALLAARLGWSEASLLRTLATHTHRPDRNETMARAALLERFNRSGSLQLVREANRHDCSLFARALAAWEEQTRGGPGAGARTGAAAPSSTQLGGSVDAAAEVEQALSCAAVPRG